MHRMSNAQHQVSVYTRTYASNSICKVTPSHCGANSRQTQELDRKLRNAQMEILNLRSQMQQHRLAALDNAELEDITWRRGSTESDVREPILAFDFTHVREEIIRRSPGLFNVPPAWREVVPDPLIDQDAATADRKLPPREFTNHLIHLFMTEVSAISPSMDLQTFGDKVNELYESETERDAAAIPLNISRSWLVVFFAILALTAHCIQDDIIMHDDEAHDGRSPVGWDLAQSAMSFFGPVTKKTTLDDVRGALTLAMYFRLLNELGATNIWFGIGCKIAQYLGTSIPRSFDI